MRIATLLPSATEIACTLGLADEVVAITHECDHPPEIRNRPVVVRPRVASAALSSHEIDAQVEAALARGEPLYEIDVEALAAARPDLVITQDLCEVCALPSLDVDRVVGRLPGRPRVLRLHPHTLDDILDNVVAVGEVAGREADAHRLVAEMRARIARVRAAVGSAPLRESARGPGSPPAPGSTAPRVFCMEWLDPPFCSGHWMPELVALAGGTEVLGRRGRPSFRVEWDEIARAAPEVVVLTVCGFDVRRTCAELPAVTPRSEWRALPAVTAGRVYATDGSSYFSRSGPRIIDGLEIMAAILHPEAAAWTTPPGSWLRLETAVLRGGTPGPTA